MISSEVIYYNAAMRLAIYGPPQHAARSTSTAEQGIYRHPYVALPAFSGEMRYTSKICERNGRKRLCIGRDRHESMSVPRKCQSRKSTLYNPVAPPGVRAKLGWGYLIPSATLGTSTRRLPTSFVQAMYQDSPRLLASTANLVA